MNILKKSILAGSLLLAFAAGAQAQTTTVTFTGSSAYRSQTHQAIRNSLLSGYTFGFSGTSGIGSAGRAIFKGKINDINGNSQDVVIKTFWSGSEAGIKAVAGSQAAGFLVDSTPTSLAGTQGASTSSLDSRVPDIAMADTFQAASVYNGIFRGSNYVTLVDNIVGVVPFVWVAQRGTPGITNITSQLARATFSTGKTPFALFTGNTTDHNKFLYATGRDPDSGTRLTALAEIGSGAQANVTHYYPTRGGVIADTVGTLASNTLDASTFTTLWPAGTVNGNPVSGGNGGFPSGGGVAAALSSLTPDSTKFLISPVGTSDATTATGNGAVQLTYNGVAYTTQGVKEGSYTFWGYEHLMYRDDLANLALDTATAVANQINTVTAVIFVSDMQVGRDTDGGNVTALY